MVGNNHVTTVQLYQSFLRTPGEARPINKVVLIDGIVDGVRKGLFGLGELEGDKPCCRYFKEYAEVTFSNNEILIAEHICIEQNKIEQLIEEEVPTTMEYQVSESMNLISEKSEAEAILDTSQSCLNKLMVKFTIPKGKISDIMHLIKFIQNKFETLRIELIASDGKISNQ